MKLPFKGNFGPEWTALAVGALLAAGTYAGLIHPSLASMAAMDQARVQRNAANRDLLDAQRKLQDLRARITDQKRQLAEVGGSPPSLNEKDVQIAKLAAVAHDCRLDVDQYQPIGELDGTDYSAAYVQFTARGSFPKICEFLGRVESEMEYVDVTHLVLASTANPGQTDTNTCLISWSCRLSGMPRKPSEPGKPAAPTDARAAEVAMHD